MNLCAGEPQTTQQTVRSVMDRAYGPDFYAGDEGSNKIQCIFTPHKSLTVHYYLDNGEMGAWFVMSALGLFAARPGAHPSYVLTSPLFRHVTVQRFKDKVRWRQD